MKKILLDAMTDYNAAISLCRDMKLDQAKYFLTTKRMEFGLCFYLRPIIGRHGCEILNLPIRFCFRTPKKSECIDEIVESLEYRVVLLKKMLSECH